MAIGLKRTAKFNLPPTGIFSTPLVVAEKRVLLELIELIVMPILPVFSITRFWVKLVLRSTFPKLKLAGVTVQAADGGTPFPRRVISKLPAEVDRDNAP